MSGIWARFSSVSGSEMSRRSSAKESTLRRVAAEAIACVSIRHYLITSNDVLQHTMDIYLKCLVPSRYRLPRYLVSGKTQQQNSWKPRHSAFAQGRSRGQDDDARWG